MEIAMVHQEILNFPVCKIKHMEIDMTHVEFSHFPMC
jgi:hypothetical protein